MAKIISSLVNQIKPSPTLAITEKAMAMKAAGINVISLSAGEPDFDTPDNIKLAAIKAIQNGNTKYTPVDGTRALKQAVQDKFVRENNLKFDLDQITVGSGAKQVIFNALLASINPGDEVIIPAPYWVSYPEMVIFAGGTSVIVECLMSSGFKLKPVDLEKSITSRTKWLILNSPSNPTGAVYSPQELQEIAKALLKYPQVYILCDDIYEHITFDQFQFNSLATIEPKLSNRILTVNGLSKGYSMTGWRLGYAGGPKELIAAISTVQSQSTSNPCSISQAAGVEALVGPQEFVREKANIFQKRRDLVLDRIDDITGLSCSKPGGAFYLFPNCSALLGTKSPKGALIASSVDIAAYLLEEALVAVVPGSAFGMEGFFRISYATSESNLDIALKRIKEACEKLI
ncbi:MAG: Aspartate/methionine/tyrosine aminotransferase [Candidatus Midichloria mitochondrii]|uniref:Aminotransferase n=1 Tax=Midichloria mitochondrii (strain IricVA) TaxID=696127 RepID=F7XWV8_MIDMI|nr:pyridoxal phosphate-dependent aminotransferase [Candidatus Midichloria mitochondrii]AEI89157.1 aspartate/tyrosine/aromatic aminotransferase [Candidatus Midichloria mitochondrii IricVA]MDJ1256074.1 pyridoxal phosphate-dependent aminotransferase [Candidatus Midichloria mitochondrii]MDJ1287772.1 pyridoxal phosphate-dependent aminotransferase [Candidatus Midichloria mitochondrii]MDJ1298740.1 pyridoxal phosphate-dependent aminotransferase [Candidatus Midichloria mitochondrii]MDJ1312622.1 pyridox